MRSQLCQSDADRTDLFGARV